MKLAICLGMSLCAIPASFSQSASPRNLAERLGYGPDERLLIVNGDDAGMCHAANSATLESMEEGLMSSATLMVPCPWFGEIAEYARTHPRMDFGIHLCHTSEWKHYRWGPVAERTEVPGLIDSEGYLWRSIEEVYENATPREALIEARAQIRKALKAGVDLTHLDSHMGTLQYDPRYVEIYLELAVEFDLPVRMASQSTLERFNQGGLRAKFAKQGILFPDYFIYEELQDGSNDVKEFWMGILDRLQPGVTELYIHAGKPTAELRAITNSWRTRAAEFETFTHDEDVKRLVGRRGIRLVGYRPIRELQRKLGKTAP